MAVIDYIFIALCAVMLVVGILKGFLKLLFGFLGIILIPIGTAYLSAYPQQWMASLITDQALLTIAALVVTFIALSLIYGMITALIVKLIHKATGLRAVDRIVGAVMSVAIRLGAFRCSTLAMSWKWRDKTMAGCFLPTVLQ